MLRSVDIGGVSFSVASRNIFIKTVDMTSLFSVSHSRRLRFLLIAISFSLSLMTIESILYPSLIQCYSQVVKEFASLFKLRLSALSPNLLKHIFCFISSLFSSTDFFSRVLAISTTSSIASSYLIIVRSKVPLTQNKLNEYRRGQQVVGHLRSVF